ncbi:MAG: 2-C-methyl-D-erythritol 2,4-cyclodiphosphate synthase [Bdellovibrionota bacterium]
MRFGIGYDIHRLMASKEPSHIPIGGVQIPCSLKIESHSDGDVLLHAVVDAILGSLALGDIGRWFPDSEPENRARPSHEFLEIVLKKAYEMGWVVKQLDSIVHLETPRLADQIDRIRESLAGLLNIEMDRTSVKAKSGEGLGPVGTRNALAAQAYVVLVERS